MRNIQQHFSIHKLTIGAASVLIGLSLLGFGTQTVHADANDTAVQATSEKVDASTSEAKNDVKTEDVKVEIPVTDDKAATDPTTKEEKTTEPADETPATPVTVSDKDAKTPATEGDAGKSTDVEKPAVPTDTTKAATDKAQDSVATKDQTLKVDQAKNGAVDPKTLKEEKSFLHQKEWLQTTPVLELKLMIQSTIQVTVLLLTFLVGTLQV